MVTYPDSMLETLQKMSGTTHKVYKDTKTITRDNEQLFNKAEGKISYTMTAKEVPVISYNDMAFIGERNSILFRAGDSPIWNRNETILPMSWRLFKNTIKVPGKEFSLQTIPTLSTALDFDVRKNTPDFMKMVQDRLEQAREAPGAMKAYKAAYGYSDYQLAQLDPDIYSDEVMEIIHQTLLSQAEDYGSAPEMDEDLEERLAAQEADADALWSGAAQEARDRRLDAGAEKAWKSARVDKDVAAEAAKSQAEYDERCRKRFAGGTLSREDLCPILASEDGACPMGVKRVLINAWMDCKGYWSEQQDGVRGEVVGGHDRWYGPDGSVFVEWRGGISAEAEELNARMEDVKSNVFGEERISEDGLSWENQVHMSEKCVKWLAGMDSWKGLAGGEFDRAAARFAATM